MAKTGRPTFFKPEYSDLAQKFCMLGATNEDLARMFGVARRAIDNWIAGVPEFAAALREGREIADANVACRLYARANRALLRVVRIPADERAIEVVDVLRLGYGSASRSKRGDQVWPLIPVSRVAMSLSLPR